MYRLPDHYIDGIVETVWTPGVGCGAFPFGLDCNHDTSPEFELQPRDKYGRFFLWTMRLIEGWVHTRCKNFELPFGDQVRKMPEHVLLMFRQILATSSTI